MGKVKPVYGKSNAGIWENDAGIRKNGEKWERKKEICI